MPPPEKPVVNPPPHLSPSQLQQYLQCPLAYYYRYLEKRPPEQESVALCFGRAVHDALAYHYRYLKAQNVRPPAAELQAVFIDSLGLQIKEAQAPLAFNRDLPDVATALARGRALLDLFAVEAAAKPPPQVVAVEQKLRAPLNDERGRALSCDLVGVIDLLVRRTDGRLLLVDHKTRTQKVAEHLLAADLQFSAYAFLLLNAGHWSGTEPLDCTLQVLHKRRDPKISWQPTCRERADLVRFAKLARKVRQGIEADIFVPHHSFLCPGCPYQIACGQWAKPTVRVLPTLPAGGRQGRQLSTLSDTKEFAMHEKATSFQNVCDTVAAKAQNHTDHLVPSRALRFQNLHTLEIDHQPYSLAITASRQIANRLGVPYSYLAKCPGGLQAENLNSWLAKLDHRQLLFRFDGSRIRAILTEKYRPVDHLQILEELVKLGVRPETRVQVVLDEQMLLLNLPDPSKAFTVGKHDRMQPGIAVSNSEVGLASLSIAAYVYRLVCLNGLISQTKVHARSFRHVSDKVLEALPETIATASENTTQLAHHLHLALDSPVANPKETLARLNRQFALDAVEQQAVDWAWPFEAGGTLFHVIQTFTRASQYPQLTAEGAYRLQKTGGAILEMVEDKGEWAHAA